MSENNPILQVKDLTVSFNAFAGKVQAVRGVSFDLNKGETLCIVGENFGRVVGGEVVLHVQRPVGVMLFQNGVNLVWQVF